MNVTRCCKTSQTSVTFAVRTARQTPHKLSGLTNIHWETAPHLLLDCHTFTLRLPHICCETAPHLLWDCHTFAARMPHICCETALHSLRGCTHQLYIPCTFDPAEITVTAKSCLANYIRYNVPPTNKHIYWCSKPVSAAAAAILRSQRLYNISANVNASTSPLCMRHPFVAHNILVLSDVIRQLHSHITTIISYIGPQCWLLIQLPEVYSMFGSHTVAHLQFIHTKHLSFGSTTQRSEVTAAGVVTGNCRYHVLMSNAQAERPSSHCDRNAQFAHA